MGIRVVVTPMSTAFLGATAAMLYCAFEFGGPWLALGTFAWGCAIAYLIGHDSFKSGVNTAHAHLERMAHAMKEMDAYVKDVSRRNVELSQQLGVQHDHVERKAPLKSTRLQGIIGGPGPRRDS